MKLISALKQGCSQAVRALTFSSSRQMEAVYLEGLSAEEVKSKLRAIGLNQDWSFTDFDEALIEQSSQHLWAKAIIDRHKAAIPAVLLKYLCHYKWRENLFELNKIFRYSDGLKQLTEGVIPRLRLNENAVEILNRIRNKRIHEASVLKKIAYRFLSPVINLVIVSRNCGIIIRLFLDREDVQRRFRDNKVMILAVVSNKMAFDEKGNISGLSDRENIIDINTKKDYIPKSNIVLIDKRDSNLKSSHVLAVLVESLTHR